MNNSKQEIAFNSDMNNNGIINTKKTKSIINKDKRLYTIGQIKELHMLNFMCYKNFSIQFHPTHMQIITGANGSGKSTIANAISLCLGAQARTTGRTSIVQSFIKKGETSAELTIILANEGPEAFKPELYGKEIQIIRRIGSRQSSYKILGANHKIISTHKETIDEIIQALSISPENPLCVLHQEIAKTFLINNDSKKKYQFYMKVSQLDQIKQAYEQGIYTVQLLTQRVNAMKEKHMNMLRDLEPLEQKVKKIEIRRDYEQKRHVLEAELISARTDQARQELLEIQSKFEQIQKNKDNIDAEILQANNKILEIDQKLNNYLIEKNDLEKDINSLKELISHFLKQKQDIQLKISSLTQEYENYQQILIEIKYQQIYLQKQIDKYENLNQQSNNNNQQRLNIEHEISIRKEKQIESDNIIISLTNDIHINNENIHNKQLTIHLLENQLKQKQNDLNELIKIDQDKTNIDELWMSDCLITIQNDQRFHKKPIGPINRYIHCIDPHWSYAVEKHLAPIMSSFICTDNHDEKILIEIFLSYSSDYRPPIYIRKYSDKVYDISGTLKYIKQANLLSIHDVLKINNITVECALIDFKQIEATILIENIEQIKQIKEYKLLNWKKINKKVKHVIEAWTYDGSNIKFDNTYRIYTNEKQIMKYFLSNNNQSLSIEELEYDIKYLYEQIKQINQSINQLKTIQQIKINEINQTNTENINNKNKITELMKELDYFISTLPIILDCSLDELQEKSRNYLINYTDINHKYDQIKEKKQENLQYLNDIIENLENITKKFDLKTFQYDLLIENLHNEQLKYDEIQHKIKKLKKKSLQFNKNISKYKNKLKQLKLKKTSFIIRSIRDIQQELNAINNYLKSNQDTNDERREIINKYRIKRNETKQYKEIYERCYQQIEHLKQFINKRQEGFLIISDQHQYYLRIKFQNLMKKYHFNDSDIKIDHKNEELQIIIKNYQNNLTLLSGGERSISTFCFLLALWESIYQPFRLLDEIDIYMDNEKLYSSLEILYENTLYYSSSQHIILTPQIIDSKLWNNLNIPVFNMPTPKRSL